MANLLEILHSIRPECDFVKSCDFLEDGLLDSLDMVVLVSELDAQFCISITGVDIVPENFQNIAAIKNLLIKYNVQL